MNVTDTFNRADSSTTLGTTSDGNATWTAVVGTWGISSNAAYCPTLGAGSLGVATVPSTADVTVQADITVNSSNAVGIAFRVSDANNYWIVIRHTSGGSSGLWKVVGGSFTHVATFSMSVGDTIAAVLAGSSITCKVNGSTVGTAADSFNSTATGHGLYTESTSGRLDNFSVTPPVAPAFRPPSIRACRTQPIMRTAVR